MGVLEKNPADPLRDGEEKHVVAESCRPIGHGETYAFARDHSAAANEKQRGDGGEKRETMQPGILGLRQLVTHAGKLDLWER
jgi:hypothetical protein